MTGLRYNNTGLAVHSLDGRVSIISLIYDFEGCAALTEKLFPPTTQTHASSFCAYRLISVLITVTAVLSWQATVTIQVGGLGRWVTERWTEYDQYHSSCMDWMTSSVTEMPLRCFTPSVLLNTEQTLLHFCANWSKNLHTKSYKKVSHIFHIWICKK